MILELKPAQQEVLDQAAREAIQLLQERRAKRRIA